MRIVYSSSEHDIALRDTEINMSPSKSDYRFPVRLFFRKKPSILDNLILVNIHHAQIKVTKEKESNESSPKNWVKFE